MVETINLANADSALASQNAQLAQTDVAAPPKTNTPANNVVPFARGGGFNWTTLLANLAKTAAVALSPLLGSGAELKVLKFADVLPDSLSERDFQFGTIAAEDAGVTSDTMERWTPDQRGQFLEGGSKLLQHRQDGLLSEADYKAELTRLVDTVEAAGPEAPDPEELGQSVGEPERQESVQIGPPSSRVRQIMQQNPGMSREEAEQIASNEAVFSDGTGRDAARVEGGDGTDDTADDDAAVSQLKAEFDEFLADLDSVPEGVEDWSSALDANGDVTKLRDRIYRTDDLLVRVDSFTPTHMEALEEFSDLGVTTELVGSSLTTVGDEQVGVVATEFVSGANLEIKIMAADMGTEEMDRDAWAEDITDTLSTIHNADWLHRDVKSDQFLGEPGDVKLIDLESAQRMDMSTDEGVSEFKNELGRTVELLFELREDDDDMVMQDIESYLSKLDPEKRAVAEPLLEDLDSLLSDLE